MRVAFPVSAPVMYRESILNTFVTFDPLVLQSPLYVAAVAKRIDRGDRVIHFGSHPVPGTSDVVSFGSHVKGCGFYVTPRAYSTQVDMYGNGWDTDYLKACESPDVSTIVIGPGGDSFSAILFIEALVSEGKFCTTKPHWIYGVDNPAVLAVYRSVFSPFILNKIELAVCSTCFIYSQFGVLFSDSVGWYMPLPGIPVTDRDDLGMLRWVNSDMDRSQYRVFQHNMDGCYVFGRGFGGSQVVERARAILEERSDGRIKLE